MLVSISCGIIFIILKIIIHKHNFDEQQLAKELINKFPTKDRIINALQIYSKLDKKNPYSDLTIKAIEDLKEEVKILNINTINFKSHTQKVYLLLFSLILLISLFSMNSNFYSAAYRITQNNTFFKKPLPFNLAIENIDNNQKIFKGDKYLLNINGTGNLPNKIELNWI